MAGSYAGKAEHLHFKKARIHGRRIEGVGLLASHRLSLQDVAQLKPQQFVRAIPGQLRQVRAVVS